MLRGHTSSRWYSGAFRIRPLPRTHGCSVCLKLISLDLRLRRLHPCARLHGLAGDGRGAQCALRPWRLVPNILHVPLRQIEGSRSIQVAHSRRWHRPLWRRVRRQRRPSDGSVPPGAQAHAALSTRCLRQCSLPLSGAVSLRSSTCQRAPHIWFKRQDETDDLRQFALQSLDLASAEQSLACVGGSV